MIRKLQRQFIIINMSLVTMILLIVLGVLLLSHVKQQQQDTYAALQRAVEPQGIQKIEIGRHGQPNKTPPPFARTAIFTVKLDSAGAILQINDEEVSVSQESIEQAIQGVPADSQRGVLRTMGLRYYVKQLADGQKMLAFADLAQENMATRRLLTSALLVGIGGFFGLLLVSICLSGMALRPVQRAWEQQRQFVADASHELKTPLTVILANMDILMNHPQQTIEAQRKWIEHTRAEAGRMKALVEEMLFLARSDSAPLQKTQQRLDLSDAAWNCLLPFEPVAYEQGVTLDSEIMPDLWVLGDLAQMKQLMVILLDNACKYAEPVADSGKKVWFFLDTIQDKIRIRVRNTSAPIPPEELAHLFERFYRVDKSRAKQGYGLGLAIAERIVQTHHGKISAESNIADGTTFTVLLPRG